MIEEERGDGFKKPRDSAVGGFEGEERATRVLRSAVA